MLNNVTVMGRLVRDPLVFNKTDNGQEHMWTRYTLAVNRDYNKQGKQNVDYINCFAFGAKAKFAAKYLFQGTKIVVQGRIQSGRYTDESGKDTFTTGIYVLYQYFAESGKKDIAIERDVNHQEDMGVGQEMEAYEENFERYMENEDIYENVIY